MDELSAPEQKHQGDESLTDHADNQDSSSLIPSLRVALAELLPHTPASLAYLHGSYATGNTTPFSDVDIALVVNQPLSPLERLRLLLRIQSKLSDQVGVSNIDVRVINDAPLIFQGRVVTDGILLFARDDQERVDYEVSTRLRYFDYLPIHRQLQESFFADIRERGLYG